MTQRIMGIAGLKGSIHDAVAFVESLNYTEPKFVLVVMVVAATRPVVTLAEQCISPAARWLPVREGIGFYLAALILGPLLGSFFAEPAAMTLQVYLAAGLSPDKVSSRRQ